MKSTDFLPPGQASTPPMRDNDSRVYKYSDLTRKIIGCAIEVHKALGTGFQEVIYQRALAMEMDLQNISYKREFEMPIK